MSAEKMPTVHFQGMEANPLNAENAIAEANAIIYLMSNTLAYMAENDDSLKERGGTTAEGLIYLDARVRKNLANAN